MAISDFLFKEKEEKYLKKIEDLEKVLRVKDEQISYLGEILEKTKEDLEKEKNKFSPKQIEIFERNLKKSTEDSKKYRSFLLAYRINPDKNINKYKIELKKFYSEKKFEEITNILNEKGVFFVDELNEVKFHFLEETMKNLDEAKRRFLDFKNGKYTWEISTLLHKGEKISKIYAKSKKLVTVLSELYLEFMDDIEAFDFSILKNYGFKTPQIEEFVVKRDEYYKEYKVSE